MKEEVVQRVREHYGDFKKKYSTIEEVGIFLQGSQNYNLDYEESDVDTKMILLPSFEDFVKVKNPMSYTFVRENNEHIDLKDIRTTIDTFRKQNINFVEILFTDYMILNDKYSQLFYPLIEQRERVARYDIYTALNCMLGMAMQKYKAMEHPYPTIVHKIEKYGYDPKQLHHIVRMAEFIQRYTQGEPYKDCLIAKDREYMIAIKTGLYDLETARDLAKRSVEKVAEVKNKYIDSYDNKVDVEVKELMEEVVLSILKQSFREQLLIKGD